MKGDPPSSSRQPLRIWQPALLPANGLPDALDRARRLHRRDRLRPATEGRRHRAARPGVARPSRAGSSTLTEPGGFEDRLARRVAPPGARTPSAGTDDSCCRAAAPNRVSPRSRTRCCSAGVISSRSTPGSASWRSRARSGPTSPAVGDGCPSRERTVDAHDRQGSVHPEPPPFSRQGRNMPAALRAP
jgi:hypothetical protein